MYEMLGMLGENMGRFDLYTGDPIPELVESFYPHETHHADHFESLLRAHAALTGLEQDWTRKGGRQKHVRFYSSRWSGVMNSFYVKTSERTATLDARIFEDASEAETLLFLKGVFSRYGSTDKSSHITMANAPHKVTTIGTVLTRLGCSNVVVYVLEWIPHSYAVHFEPSPIVLEQLEIEKITLEPDRSGNADWKIFKRIR